MPPSDFYVGGCIVLYTLTIPVCFQAHLSFYNPRQNLLTRLFGCLGVFRLVVGNFSFIYLMMLSGLIREDYDLMKVGLLSPVSWLLMSLAAWLALCELVTRPHFWQKTQHGLTSETRQLLQGTRLPIEYISRLSLIIPPKTQNWPRNTPCSSRWKVFDLSPFMW